MKKTVLIIDNYLSLIEHLSAYLPLDAYELSFENDGEKGIKKALNQKFDAIILELALSKLNGFQIIKAIRQHDQLTPILMIASQGESLNKLIAFKLGADDYLVKPCSPLEILARLENLLKRNQNIHAPKTIIQYHNIRVDCVKRIVELDEKPIELTNTEFNILEVLIKTPGQAFSKEELTEYALGRKYTPYDRSVDVHISNLRNKLGSHSIEEPWIKTVRGFGYLFNLPLI